MFGSKSRASSRYVAPIPQFLIAATPAAPADSHPVIDELAEVAKDALNMLVRSALAGAGRHFTARSEKTPDERERRELLDTLHALRLSVSPVLRAFTVELERAFARPAPTPTAPAPHLNPLCQSVWQGLREQLDSLSGRFALAPMTERFSPERLQLAIHSCLARTELTGRAAALTQELLEQGVLSHLDQVYRRMAERLEQYSLPGAGPQFGVVANQSVAAAAPPTALHIDPLTKALLVDVARTRIADAGPAYTNAHLAAELLESLKSEQETIAVRTRAIVQRLGLVGRLIGAVAAHTQLPESFKQSFEKLRLPMIKSALVDASFLADKSHSLRMLTADLVRRALGSDDADAALERAVESAAADFDLSAAFVRPALAGLRPLAPAVIEKFLADLQDEGAELARLADDQASRQDRARSMRERLMDLQEPEPAPTVTEPAANDAPAPPAEMPAVAEPVVPATLETLLRSTRWYRVYDHRQKKMRWLRLEAFYPQRDALAFTEFDGSNPLCMEAHAFLDDLCSGRSAPCNADAQVRRLIQQLQRERPAA